MDIKDKSLIFRKYVLYLDVLVKQNLEAEVGQKLNSFFGQVGIFENTEKILEYISEYIKSLNIENIFFNDDTEFNIENTSINIDDNSENKFVFYLPIVLIFYYGDKKVDFYLYSSWHKNLSIKNIKNLFMSSYANIINNNDLLLLNLNYFQKINKINRYFFKFSENLYSKSKLTLFFNKNCFNFFTQEFMHNSYYDEYTNYKLKKLSRLFFFKKIKFKNKNMLVNLNKYLCNAKNDFIVYFNIVKLFFIDNYSNDYDILEEHIKFLSKIYDFKNNFYKRFRRKKKFKKKLVKNFVGKRFTFFNIYNSIEVLKKKKRK